MYLFRPADEIRSSHCNSSQADAESWNGLLELDEWLRNIDTREYESISRNILGAIALLFI